MSPLVGEGGGFLVVEYSPIIRSRGKPVNVGRMTRLEGGRKTRADDPHADSLTLVPYQSLAENSFDE
jgi:hypothetical protein